MADKIRVPQESGEVTLSVAGGEPRTFRITDHLLSPANQDEYDLVLATIEGAKPAPSTTAQNREK